MSKNEPGLVQSSAPREGAPALATFCAAGGLLAAFGLASCCALPMLLAGFGVGSTALVGIALLAVPHRHLLLAVALLSLSATAALWLWRRRAPLAANPTRSPSVLKPMSIGMAVIAVVLLVLAFWVEPPL